MTAHASLTGADLHEPKGVAAASSGEVYIADGAGSGAWTALNNANKVYVTKTITDISTAKSSWVVPGIAGTITKIKSVINGAIATADCALTFEIGGVVITGAGITITQAGSAAGDVDSSSPSGNNTITENSAVELITNGASTNTVDATITLEIST